MEGVEEQTFKLNIHFNPKYYHTHVVLKRSIMCNILCICKDVNICITNRYSYNLIRIKLQNNLSLNTCDLFSHLHCTTQNAFVLPKSNKSTILIIQLRLPTHPILFEIKLNNFQIKINNLKINAYLMKKNSTFIRFRQL